MHMQYPNLKKIQFNEEEFQKAMSEGEDAAKNFVGNNIYHIIQEKYGDESSGKITGMLLDNNTPNFHLYLTNP